jgi:hypothetical protein
MESTAQCRHSVEAINYLESRSESQGWDPQAYFQSKGKPKEKVGNSGKSHSEFGSRFHSFECLTNLSALRRLQTQCIRPKEVSLTIEAHRSNIENEPKKKG